MIPEDAARSRSETTLDPEDWDAFRARAHAMLDAAVDKMQAASEGRVWTPVPDALMDRLKTGLPIDGEGADAADAAISSLLPHGIGNTHPRFFGWVHGSGTPSNIVADIAAASINANAGGRDHAAIHVERQLIAWMRELFGFPQQASGLVVSGTSMATIVALKVARDKALDFRSRTAGTGDARLVGYTSEQAHACNSRAFDLLGIGSDALRKVPVGKDFRIDPAALQAMIDEDRAAGFLPFVVIGTAGTVNTGAIDNLAALASLARQEALWLHVDGAFGAAGMMSERLRPLLAGIEQADSIAFDFHKWLHVNYDAGFAIVRDGTAHMDAFSGRPDYLKRAERGMAAASPWPVEFGPELSRGFRALKVWAQLTEHGTGKLGAAITANCEQAVYLAGLVDAEDQLERLAPVATSICCFRYLAAGFSEASLDALNADIVIRLQERGIAAPSTTRLDGKLAIRVNITNHRTRFSDLDLLVGAIGEVAAELVAELK